MKVTANKDGYGLPTGKKNPYPQFITASLKYPAVGNPDWSFWNTENMLPIYFADGSQPTEGEWEAERVKQYWNGKWLNAGVRTQQFFDVNKFDTRKIYLITSEAPAEGEQNANLKELQDVETIVQLTGDLQARILNGNIFFNRKVEGLQYKEFELISKAISTESKATENDTLLFKGIRQVQDWINANKLSAASNTCTDLLVQYGKGIIYDKSH